MTLSHTSMRALMIPAFAQQIGRPATRPELQCCQAVGFLETSYAVWKPPGTDSGNCGAIQGTGPAGSFIYTDTHPNQDGSSTPYSTTFRKYPSIESGVQDLVHVVYQDHNRQSVLAAATGGGTYAFSAALHATGYYEGFGATVAERIEHHRAAVVNACRLMALELGEPMPDGSAPVPLPLAALHQGMTGDRVSTWQRVLNAAGYTCVVDGSFGPKTRVLTMFFQQALKVPADGVVGPQTETAADKAAVGRAPPAGSTS